MPREELFYYYLERWAGDPEDPIQSMITVEVGTDDPYRTLHVINSMYLEDGFVVAAFISESDLAILEDRAQ